MRMAQTAADELLLGLGRATGPSLFEGQLEIRESPAGLDHPVGRFGNYTTLAARAGPGLSGAGRKAIAGGRDGKKASGFHSEGHRMALIVETGSVVAGADSCVSLADALTLISKWSTDTTFAAATTQQQEVALRQAAMWLDAKYEPLLSGERISAAQTRAWPRSCAVTVDGWPVGWNEVPDAWKLAQSLAAIRALAGPLAPDVATDGALVEKETKVGSITTRKKWADQSGTASQPNFLEIGNALASLLTGSGIVGRRDLA